VPNYRASWMLSHSAMATARTGIAVVLAAMAVAGCSGGFGGPKPAKAVQQQQPVDPNAFPASYRPQIAGMLTTLLTDRADFHGALIAPPVLKPIGQNQTQHYVVCLQLNGHGQHRNKVVYFLAGVPTQFIDATPEICGDSPYQPFTELEIAAPSR
jgi:hypothetical protein